jgi:hypothetical protein
MTAIAASDVGPGQQKHAVAPAPLRRRAAAPMVV